MDGGDAAHYGSWHGGEARVQELDTEGEESDAQGAGSVTRRSTRLMRDFGHFADTYSGDGRGHYRDSRNEHGDSTSNATNSEEGDDDDDDREEEKEDNDDDYGGGGGGGGGNYLHMFHLGPREREEVLLLQSAFQRISEAQAMGDSNVHLSKQEIEALARYQARKDEEEEQARRKKKRHSGSGSEKKKRTKEQRMAVPLAQLAGVSHKKKPLRPSSSELPSRQDASPRQVTTDGELPPDGRDGQGYPPMGYFPPPSVYRTRSRAGTTASSSSSSSRRALDDYEYLSRSWAANSPRPSRDPLREEGSSALGSRFQADPFQFQTAGPRAPHSAGAAAASGQHASSGSGPYEVLYEHRRGTAAPAAARSRHGSRRTSYGDETSEEQSLASEGSASDEHGGGSGSGAQIREPESKARGRGRGRKQTIIVEESPERGKGKKKSSSPVKGKQAGAKKKKR
ncbi:uncharacterized protein UV8b_03940 [Ustilaginoidea virens]|uniref:COPII vesicles protein n=1 Tax=Ustilaginoidea virens TaxID=1159556 RepID=A0A8E5HQB1_USTVR|nr:uncharacterized protein UV8b_03940 [Ustilaginoidea virens]QUC19699.1 hypothetical protein UV8b_03940 [Ustilaginoidea virens]